jgi:hypothetical protein
VLFFGLCFIASANQHARQGYQAQTGHCSALLVTLSGLKRLLPSMLEHPISSSLLLVNSQRQGGAVGRLLKDLGQNKAKVPMQMAHPCGNWEWWEGGLHASLCKDPCGLTWSFNISGLPHHCAASWMSNVPRPWAPGSLPDYCWHSRSQMLRHLVTTWTRLPTMPAAGGILGKVLSGCFTHCLGQFSSVYLLFLNLGAMCCNQALASPSRVESAKDLDDANWFLYFQCSGHCWDPVISCFRNEWKSKRVSND